MSLLSFFRGLFRRNGKNKINREELLKEMLKTGEEELPVTDKKILNALAGKTDAFSAEEELNAFIGLGWDLIKNDLYEFYLGRKICLPSFLRRIAMAFSPDSETLAALCYEDMPVEQKLLYLDFCTIPGPEDIAEEIEALLPSLDREETGSALAVLASRPSAKAKELLCEFLRNEDWRLRMKAASALSEQKAFDCIPALREAAESSEGKVASGLEVIAARMEKAAAETGPAVAGTESGESGKTEDIPEMPEKSVSGEIPEETENPSEFTPAEEEENGENEV